MSTAAQQFGLDGESGDGARTGRGGVREGVAGPSGDGDAGQDRRAVVLDRLAGSSSVAALAAAEALDISPTTLWRKMKRLGIEAGAPPTN